MSNKGSGVPDAWDDDWVTVADKPEIKEPGPPPAHLLTKAQRRAQHAEQQKLLWDSAETNNRSFFLESQGIVPLKQEFKAPPKLLSRKPQAPVLARKGDVNEGLSKAGLHDYDDNSEEEVQRTRESELEERQRQARIAREEKQRRYAEARERIMGSPTPSTPPASSRDNSQGRADRHRAGVKSSNVRLNQAAVSGQSPSRTTAAGTEQLFDPNDMGRRLPRSSQRTPTPLQQEQPVRQPRGPEKNGSGGFGFTP